MKKQLILLVAVSMAPLAWAQKGKTNTTMVPVTDLGTGTYKSFEGGLYENGSNTIPSDHEADGLSALAQIQPLDQNGNPSVTGKIVLLGLGMSNVQTEWQTFVSAVAQNSAANHKTLAVLDGGISGAIACVWTVPFGPSYPTCPFGSSTGYYESVETNVINPAGLSENQVQIVWFKDAENLPLTFWGLVPLCNPTQSGCENTVQNTDAMRYEYYLGGVMRAVKARYANVKMFFLSSRIYGGYNASFSPEPNCYEYAFSTRWAIEAQINQIRTGTIDPVAGDVGYDVAPWTAWGPYLWADGPIPRSDGLVWCNGQESSPCDGEIDFDSDGVHPDTLGQDKVSNMLMNFFSTSQFTKSWFLAP